MKKICIWSIKTGLPIKVLTKHFCKVICLFFRFSVFKWRQSLRTPYLRTKTLKNHTLFHGMSRYRKYMGMPSPHRWGTKRTLQAYRGMREDKLDKSACGDDLSKYSSLMSTNHSKEVCLVQLKAVKWHPRQKFCNLSVKLENGTILINQNAILNRMRNAS